MIAYYSPAYDALNLYYYDAHGRLIWWDSEDGEEFTSTHRTLASVRSHYAAFNLAHNIIDDTGDA